MTETRPLHLPSSLDDHLLQHEEAVAWEIVALWGENRVGRTGPAKATHGVNLNPVDAIGAGVVNVDDGLFDRLLAGVALTGSAGSTAAQLGKALDRVGQARIAVTTQRLLLVEEGALTFTKSPTTGQQASDQTTTVLWSVARTEVREALHKPRPFMAGRLVIEFGDSSTVALMCGIVSPRPARRLRAALLSDLNT